MGIITTTAVGTSAAIGIIAGVTGVDMAGAGTIAGVATTAGDRMANGMAGAGAAGVGDIGIMIGIVTVGIAGTGTEFPRAASSGPFYFPAAKSKGLRFPHACGRPSRPHSVSLKCSIQPCSLPQLGGKLSHLSRTGGRARRDRQDHFEGEPRAAPLHLGWFRGGAFARRRGWFRGDALRGGALRDGAFRR
jgi:hypothetical protein